MESNEQKILKLIDDFPESVNGIAKQFQCKFTLFYLH